MKEIKIEVYSYDEARRYCEEHGLIFCDYIEEDNRCYLIAYDRTKPAAVKAAINDKKNTVIFAISDNGSKMFISNAAANKVTFKVTEAYLFEEKTAKEKAKYMTLHGRYNWIPWKVI